MVGRRGVSGLSVRRVVHTDAEHAPAQAPPLSTAAPVAMVIISRRCYVAAHVLVCLCISSSRFDASSFNSNVIMFFTAYDYMRRVISVTYLLTYKCLLSDRGT